MNRIARSALFVPASGPIGTGEYYRCLGMARALHRRRPELEIHFLLHRQADVERESAFAYHLLDHTPSHAVDVVTGHIERLMPDLAVFDCTGRSCHFRAVKAGGGRLVWVSDRPLKRLKAFRPSMLRRLDMHLILDSGNSAPGLNRVEALLLKCFGPVRVRFVSAIAAELGSGALEPWRDRLDQGAAYAVFASGGGGYQLEGTPVPEIFLEAAAAYRRASGRPVVAVMGPQYRGSIESHPEVTVLPSLPTEALGELLAGARLAVVGAGNMLSSQALTAGIPCVLAPVGGSDQPERVARYAQRSIALAAEPTVESLSGQAMRLERDPGLSARLVDGAADAGLRNDVSRVTELLTGLLDEPDRNG